VITTLQSTEPAPVNKSAEDFMDVKGYAKRLHFTPRYIAGFLAQGMPHLKIGNRRVRIRVTDADSWLLKTFGVQRRSGVR